MYRADPQRVKNDAMEKRLNELKSLILTSGSIGGSSEGRLGEVCGWALYHELRTDDRGDR